LLSHESGADTTFRKLRRYGRSPASTASIHLKPLAENYEDIRTVRGLKCTITPFMFGSLASPDSTSYEQFCSLPGLPSLRQALRHPWPPLCEHRRRVRTRCTRAN